MSPQPRKEALHSAKWSLYLKSSFIWHGKSRSRDIEITMTTERAETRAGTQGSWEKFTR